MTSNYPAATLANYENDHRSAYQHLAKEYLALAHQFSEVCGSRFIEISRVEHDSEVCLRQVTEEHISRAVDLADCEPDYAMRKWFYLDDSGELQPVTIGRQERFSNGVEQPFHFAASAIVAGGRQVGIVSYTDH